MEQEQDKCVEMLLAGVPEEGGSVKRSTLEKMIRTAFESGWKLAQVNSGIILVN